MKYVFSVRSKKIWECTPDDEFLSITVSIEGDNPCDAQGIIMEKCNTEIESKYFPLEITPLSEEPDKINR